MNLNDENHITLDLSIHRVVNVVCSQDDMNSRKLYIRLTNDGKEYPIQASDTSISIKYKLCKADNKFVYNNIDGITNDGEIFIDLTEQCTSYAGVAHTELQLMKNTTSIDSNDGQVISSMPFNVIVRPSVINNDAIESTDEFGALTELITENKVLNDSLKELENTLEENEEIRKASEEQRQQNEDNRQLEENNRTNNEETRQSNESVRVANENNRDSNELNRQKEEGIRKTNEETRQYNESVRNTRESERVEAESIRQSNETVREGNEEIRITNENARIKAENKREIDTTSAIATIDKVKSATEIATANAITATNELRSLENTVSANETVRQTQESNRQTNTQLAIEAVNVAKENAETATQETIATTEKMKGLIETNETTLKTMKTDLEDYTDKKVSELVNGAPETMDTLSELAKAIEENEEVVDALNSAIITKANADGSNATGTWGISITGTANEATRDAGGNIITDTYATKEEIDDVKAIPDMQCDIILNRQTLGYTKKNLLNNTEPTQQTVNGITYTVNPDKSITVNGTSTTNWAYIEFFRSETSIPYGLKRGVEYIAGINSNGVVKLEVFEYIGWWREIIITNSEQRFILSDNATGFIIRLNVMETGVTVSNETCYPMIRIAEITDSTYEPYIESVWERLSNIEDSGTNDYTHPNSGVTAGTYRNVTVNAQGHVTGGSNPILPVNQGGTGQTLAVDATNMFLNSLSAGDAVPTDADYFISQYVDGGTKFTTYHRRPVSKIWEYIKSKASDVYEPKWTCLFRGYYYWYYWGNGDLQLSVPTTLLHRLSNTVGGLSEYVDSYNSFDRKYIYVKIYGTIDAEPFLEEVAVSTDATVYVNGSEETTGSSVTTVPIPHKASDAHLRVFLDSSTLRISTNYDNMSIFEVLVH